MLTLAEALAMATLKGDLAAAYALADRLLEERASPGLEARAKALKMGGRDPVDGYEVYHWPEFLALIRRLGVAVSLTTQAITIQLEVDEPVTVTQRYLPQAERGADGP